MERRHWAGRPYAQPPCEWRTGFVRYCLRRHLNKITHELNRKLFLTACRVVAFDTSDLERADFKSLIEGFRAAIGRARHAVIAAELRTKARVWRRIPLSRARSNCRLAESSLLLTDSTIRSVQRGEDALGRITRLMGHT